MAETHGGPYSPAGWRSGLGRQYAGVSSSTGADCPGINHVGRERRKLNPFGQELRKILTQCKTSGVVSYAGRSAYIQLDPDLRARLEFVFSEHCRPVQCPQADDPEPDRGRGGCEYPTLWRFTGKEKVSNPNFSDGILPHLWDDYGKVDWYVYQPTQADYRLLAGTVDEYLQVFQRQEEAQEHSPQMC